MRIPVTSNQLSIVQRLGESTTPQTNIAPTDILPEKTYTISKNSLQIINENQQSIKKAIKDLLTELFYYYRQIAYIQRKGADIHFKTPVNIYLKSLARNIISKSYDNNELRKFLKTDLNSSNEYKINRNYPLQQLKYTERYLKNEFANMGVYVNEIYLDFIKFFEPLEMQGNVKQSELDLAIENFHCDSKLKIYNILFPNVKKENLIDCYNPLQLSNDITSFIPYNYTQTRELFFDSNPALHLTNAEKNFNFVMFLLVIAGLVGIATLICIIRCIYENITHRRR